LLLDYPNVQCTATPLLSHHHHQAGAYKDNPDSTLHPQDGNALMVWLNVTQPASRKASVLALRAKSWTPIGALSPEWMYNGQEAIGTFPGSMYVDQLYVCCAGGEGWDLSRDAIAIGSHLCGLDSSRCCSCPFRGYHYFTQIIAHPVSFYKSHLYFIVPNLVSQGGACMDVGRQHCPRVGSDQTAVGIHAQPAEFNPVHFLGRVSS
jgi:hypothetical protein